MTLPISEPCYRDEHSGFAKTLQLRARHVLNISVWMCDGGFMPAARGLEELEQPVVGLYRIA